jgi:hypothetical protein
MTSAWRIGPFKLFRVRNLALAFLFFALLLIAAHRAQAQTETVLYNFAGSPDGANPGSALTPDGAGNFYGTTSFGGLGYGTVYELSPNGSGGWIEAVLYRFTKGSYGVSAYPSGVIFDSLGNLYGVTTYGGANGYGAVFELIKVDGLWTEAVLHNFADGSDGAYPYGGVIMDSKGNLYGGTIQGGSNSVGTFYELSPSGSGWTEAVIYNYDFNGLTMDAAGNILGVALDDGKPSIIEQSPNGNGGWNQSVIHSFSPQLGLSNPVFDQAGNIYCAIASGKRGTGHGSVYKFTRGKKGKWTGKAIPLEGGADGSDPGGIVLDSAGNIYGIMTFGGTGEGTAGAGTVYELVAPVGTGLYQEKLLSTFNGADGTEPLGTLVLDGSGNLYGTTEYGGEFGAPYGDGVVFEVTP